MATSKLRDDSIEFGSAAQRAVVLVYGVVAYALFLLTFLYMIGFVGGFGVPKAIDDGAAGAGWAGLAVNLSLLGLFAVQHTIMARPAFKAWWTRIVPAETERSTFVLLTCGILGLLVWQWRPYPDLVWQVEGVSALLLDGLSWAGWGIVLVSTFLIDHFELFGVKQTVRRALRKPPQSTEFQERFLYRYVRHPLMLGFLIAFWSASSMSEGRLLFAAVTTAYVLLALFVEEHTLVELHGESYEDYRRRVPKLIPRLRGTRTGTGTRA